MKLKQNELFHLIDLLEMDIKKNRDLIDSFLNENKIKTIINFDEKIINKLKKEIEKHE